jgi:NitT/TauT family transport system permease protein
MKRLTTRAQPVWRPGQTKALLLRLMPLFLLLAAWQIGSRLASPGTLPPPLAVVSVVATEAWSGALFSNLAITLARVAASFALAMVFGTVLGVAMGRNKTINRLCDPLLIVLLNLPALVVIVLAYIWIGLTEAAAIGAVALNKLPNTAVTLREGARALDKNLDEMAQLFGLSWRVKARHVILPQLAPYVAAAMRSGLSLVWKIVLVVELLGRSNGVGFEIGIAFQLFDVTRLLAYALPFVGLMLAIETLIVQPFERHVSRWRQPHGA